MSKVIQSPGSGVIRTPGLGPWITLDVEPKTLQALDLESLWTLNPELFRPWTLNPALYGDLGGVRLRYLMNPPIWALVSLAWPYTESNPS